VPEEIRCAPKQLRPLQFIDDVLGYPIGSIGEILRNPAIMQVALNVLLFFPLGFFLRFTLRRGVVATTAIGFVIGIGHASIADLESSVERSVNLLVGPLLDS